MHDVRRMQIRPVCVVLAVLGACDPADLAEQQAPLDEVTKPIGDSCTPERIDGAIAVHPSCAEALASSNTTSGCYAIGTHALHVSKQCTLKRVLIAQLDNDQYGPVAPRPDAAYLDYLLDGMAAYFDENSYGRLVLDFEVAGDKAVDEAARWWLESSPRFPDLSTAYCDGFIDRPLHEYDMLGVFATKSAQSSGTPHVSITSTTDCATGETRRRTIASWTQYYYRESAEWSSPPTHEPGHALGLMHDEGLSTLSGRGTYTGLAGEIFSYGGRSSTMGADGEDVSVSLNLPERVLLGWLNDGIIGAGRHVVEVASGSRKLAIQTLESDVEGTKGVYLPTSTGGYWVEARRDPLLDPSLQTGLVLHHQPLGSDDDKQMVDGTLDTPGEKPDALPIGATYADEDSQIYITALAETPTNATLQIERAPRNAHAPTITNISADLTDTPTIFQFSVTAVDADLDPLSYSWRFGTAYESGATVTRSMAGIASMRVFVTVSDRKGGTATAYVDWPKPIAYSRTWTAPAIGSVTVRPLSFDQWVDDNELVFAITKPASTEIPAFTWTLGPVTSSWAQPIVAYTSQVNESVPACLPYVVTMTDPTNCAANPSTCSVTRSGCAPAPLRLTYALGQATVTYDAALFDNKAPTVTWSSENCAISGTTTTVAVGHGCDVRVELTSCPAGGDNCAMAFAATMHTARWSPQTAK